MINSGKEIVFLLDNQDLSNAVHDAISDVCNVLSSHYNFVGDPDDIRSEQGVMSFVRFFSGSFRKEVPFLSKEKIITLYQLTQYSGSKKPTNEELRKLCLCADLPESNRTLVSKSYFGGIKLGLQIMFQRLWNTKAVLLPYDFEPARSEFIFEQRFRDLFFSPVLSVIRAQNSRFNNELQYDSKKKRKMYDSRAVSWLKLCLATTWYESTDLSLQELFEVRDLNTCIANEFTNAKLQINLLTEVFLAELNGELNFTERDFLESQLEYYNSIGSVPFANEMRLRLNLEPVYSESTPPHKQTRNVSGNYVREDRSHKAKLTKGLKNIYGTFSVASEKDIIKSILSLTMTHMGNSQGLFDSVYEETIPAEYHASIKYWLEVQSAFLKKKRYEDESGPFGALGLLNSYLFVYLPWWYGSQAKGIKLPDFPKSLNLLNGEIFISRWFGASEDLPLDFISFAQKIGDLKQRTPNSHYGAVHPVVSFLRWCEKFKRRLKDASKFENLLENIDLPRYTGYKHSQKRPLSRRVFKMFFRFCYALYDLQSSIEKKVEEGLLNPEIFGGSQTFIKFVPITPKHVAKKSSAIQPIEFCLQDYDIEQPYVAFEDDAELKYPINGFYRFFYSKDYSINDDVKKLIYPGDIRLCLLAMHSGIRGRHLNWLDLDTFDSRVNHNFLEDYLHPLTVNTDKVKKSPWISTVSYSAMSICLEQKKWRSQINNTEFNDYIHYNGNPKSKFGAFRTLFSYEPTSGFPSPNMEKCFQCILMSFEQFLKDNGLNEEPMYKIRPSGQKYHAPINPNIVNVVTGKKSGLEFCPITYAKRTTPHASRNSVVKEKTRYLPASVVGTHITGQSERLVTYYDVLDPEDHYENQKAQWDTAPEGGKVRFPNVGDDSQEKFPTNKHGNSMHQGIIENPDEAIEAYGLISISLITDNEGNIEDGISKLKAKEIFKLAHNPTHICPFDNTCPKEVVEELGEVKACAICPYAISGINHLPAISAAKDKCSEEYLYYKDKYKALRDNPKTQEEKDELEVICDRKSLYMSAWQYREASLINKVDSINEGFERGEFLVGKPEFIANMLQPTFFDEKDNNAAYLLKRLRDSEAFPLLESKPIEAKFEMAKRKLMAIKDPASAFNFDLSKNPAKELYSLIKSYKEMYGITDEEVIQMIELSPQSLMEQLGNKVELIAG